MAVSKSFLIVGPRESLDAYARSAIGSSGTLAADVFWLKSAEGASIQVKETLEFLERSALASIGDGKLMIVCDMAAMTVQAQNKMLKTIEDGNDDTWLLLATSIEPVINTIRSRCMVRFLPSKRTLTGPQDYAMMNVRAKINERIKANCNAQNQNDLIEIERIKNAKNS